MKDIVFEFFNICGLDTTAPLTFADVLVWFVCVFVALFLVLSVFRFFSEMLQFLIAFINKKG